MTLNILSETGVVKQHKTPAVFPMLSYDVLLGFQVLHGADMDIQWLQRDLGVYVVNMFDTGQAARVLNLGRYSLAHLLQEYCDVKPDKQYQLADWRIRYDAPAV